jgi:hypothetical protein
MQSVFLWNVKMVCLALVLGVCSVAPAQALLVELENDLLTQDDRTGNVWLDFSVSKGITLETLQTNGYSDFQYATLGDIRELLANVGLTDDSTSTDIARIVQTIGNTVGYTFDYKISSLPNGSVLNKQGIIALAYDENAAPSIEKLKDTFFSLYAIGSYVWDGYIEFGEIPTGELTVHSKWIVSKSVVSAPPAPVPEPGTFVLLTAGLIGLITLNRKAFKRKPR